MNNLLSCRYNMDTNRVEARFEDETTLAIDCIAIEDEYGSTPAQRAEPGLAAQARLPAVGRVAVSAAAHSFIQGTNGRFSGALTAASHMPYPAVAPISPAPRTIMEDMA